MKLRRIALPIILLAGVVMARSLFAQATTEPSTRPAVLKLLVPGDAAATVDDKELGRDRSITYDELAPGETKRVTVNIKFPDGAEEERLVDLEQGQTIPVPVPTPQPDKAVTVAMQAVDPVLAIALSPDGQLLAAGLDSGEIVLWDLEAGRPVRTLARHHAPVQSLVFSADGKRLLSGSGDNTAVLWDLATALPVQTFKGHTDQVMSVAFSPDGKRVLTGSMDRTAIVWDAATAQTLLTISGHKDQVFGIAWSPDGTIIATASLDKSGALWDAETGRQLFDLRGHSDGVSCVAFSPDGKTVATGSFDNSAIFWDVATGKKLKQTGKHEIDIYGVAYTPDGRKLLTSARDEVVMMWDVNTGHKLRTFTGHNSDVGGAAVTSDGRLMFSCSRDGMVKLWDMATGMELASLMTDATTRSWAVVAPDGLFDASEPGRRMMGFRFSKGGGGSLDQFFNERFHPGLLSELCQGKRPMSSTPLGHAPPPLVKIISPKSRSTPTTLPVSIVVEATDQGGGLSALRLLNNGSSIAVRSDLPKAGREHPIRVTFNNIALVPGVDQIRVVGSNADDSWDSLPADIELAYRPVSHPNSRMYLIAVGDSPALVDVIRTRAARVYDRVDVIWVPDREATKDRIEETLADVGSLTKPQDSLILLLRGGGSVTPERINLICPAENEVLRMHDLASALAAAPALQRAMILDLATSATARSPDASVVREAVEKLARSHSVYILASLLPSNDERSANSLSSAMIAAAPGCTDLMEWFRISSQKIGGWCSTQLAGFPIFSKEIR